MWRVRWTVAVYKGSDPFSLSPVDGLSPAFAPCHITDIRCDGVADPFLLQRNDLFYLFFEVLNHATGRGEIAHAISSDGWKWEYQGVVLREPFHLSYPYVFESNGVIYMIPETRQTNSIRLYTASAFPFEWKHVSNLRTGAYADSSVFFHDERWWMFTQRGLDEMQILTSRNVEHGWTPHPLNPIWPGNRVYSRPGGRVLNYNGDWYRFAQDGVRNYGNNLRAMRIDKLSTAEFEEKEIAGSPVLKASRQGWNAVGMHHLDAVPLANGEWLGVVDGATFVR